MIRAMRFRRTSLVLTVAATALCVSDFHAQSFHPEFQITNASQLAAPILGPVYECAEKVVVGWIPREATVLVYGDGGDQSHAVRLIGKGEPNPPIGFGEISR